MMDLKTLTVSILLIVLPRASSHGSELPLSLASPQWEWRCWHRSPGRGWPGLLDGREPAWVPWPPGTPESCCRLLCSQEELPLIHLSLWRAGDSLPQSTSQTGLRSDAPVAFRSCVTSSKSFHLSEPQLLQV